MLEVQSGTQARTFLSVKDQVYNVLYEHESARNNDLWLQIMLYQKFYPQARLYVDYNEVQHLPSAETIRRTRQKIQNEERLFEASEQTRINRQQKAKIWRKNIRKW